MLSGNEVSRKYRDVALEPRRLRIGMRVDEPYGAALRDYFCLKIPVPAVARTLRKSRFALAHISSDEPDRKDSSSPICTVTNRSRAANRS